MGTLYLDHTGLELRRDGRAIAIYEEGKRARSVPMGLVARVVAHGDIRLSTGLIGALAEAGVGLVVLSKRHSRRTATLLGLPHRDARIRLEQYRLWHDPAARREWAARVVKAKIAAQHRLLDRALAQRSDQRKALCDALAGLVRARARAAEARALPELLGIEGAAAAAYFGGLGALFPASLGFHGRNRRPPRDPVNACLSLGYTLLHFDAARAAHAAGLDPLIGFFHEPAYGRDSLAADLIEPLRPHVDDWARELFRERRLRADHFVHDKGACLLNKRGRQRFYGAYEPLARGLRRLLRLACRRMVRELSGGGAVAGR